MARSHEGNSTTFAKKKRKRKKNYRGMEQDEGRAERDRAETTLGLKDEGAGQQLQPAQENPAQRSEENKYPQPHLPL